MGKWAWIIGGAVLLGVVAMALVPVWPSEAQIVFQYLTTGSGLFLGFLIALLIGKCLCALIGKCLVSVCALIGKCLCALTGLCSYW